MKVSLKEIGDFDNVHDFVMFSALLCPVSHRYQGENAGLILLFLVFAFLYFI